MITAEKKFILLLFSILAPLVLSAQANHKKDKGLLPPAYFSAEPEFDGIKISWITVSEQNNSHFILERSFSGDDFSELTSMACGGSAKILNSYTVSDKNPVEGVQFYRLRLTDAEGREALSRTIAVRWMPNETIRVYPNPTTGDLFVNIAPQLNGQTGKLLINHTNGQVIVSRPFRVTGSTQGMKLLKGAEKLKPGKYLVTLNFKEHSYSQLIVSR